MYSESGATSMPSVACGTAACATSNIPQNENNNQAKKMLPTITTIGRASSAESLDRDNTMRNKKPLISSTQSTIVTVASVNVEEENAVKKSAAPGKIKSKALKSGEGSSTESEKAGGRASSHQSHYSTEKSGSSGYYSSNVCSTYSLEDHIYCEPVVDGVLDLNSESKSAPLTRHIRNRVAAASGSGSGSELRVLKATTANSRSRDMLSVEASSIGCAGAVIVDNERDGDDADVDLTLKTNQGKIGMSFNENLRVLETSIENLDRHLKNFPSLSTQERTAAFVQSHHTFLPHFDVGEKLRQCRHLPTIMEGYDASSQPRASWRDDMVDDSLLDIDFDSFLLAKDNKNSRRTEKNLVKAIPGGGIDNPSFLTDEQETNHYKCAKYINSCPDDAYCLENDVSTTSEVSIATDHFRKRYEDQLHFESTRELLEDVRDKIRLLSQSSSELRSICADSLSPDADVASEDEDRNAIPQELEAMIKALKHELESYLARMNQHSEREIRQLCTGIVKNRNVVRMTKAFERRRSISSSLNPLDSESGVFVSATGVPISIRQQITTIRCASDPNFKMKRKSLANVFPQVNCNFDAVNEKLRQEITNIPEQQPQPSQMQRNLSFQQPVLNRMNSKVNNTNCLNIRSGAVIENIGAVVNESGELAGDKDSILESHRKKPSIWEMYYGTNRLSQSLLAAQRSNVQAHNGQTNMSYVSIK